MNRRTLLTLLGPLCIFCIGAGCVPDRHPQESLSSEPTHRVAFYFDKLGRMHTSASVGGEEIDVIFDTGADGPILDSAYFQGIIAQEDSTRKGFAYFPASNRRVACDIVRQEIDILLAGQVLHFDEFVLDNLQDRLGVLALVSIPENDRRAWNFDYENRTLAILDSIPADLDTSSLERSSLKRRKWNFHMTLPFVWSGPEEDTLACTLCGMMDTGSGAYLTAYGGLYVLDHKQAQSFIERSKKYATRSGDNYYVLQQIAPYSDKISIEVDHESHTAFLNFGNSLLAHYNLWLDLDNDLLYSSLSKNYARPHQDYMKNANMDFRVIRTCQGLLIDYCLPSSRSWDAGLRDGDLIIDVDGKPHYVVKPKDIFEFGDGQTQHRVSIIRDSDTLSLYITPETINLD